MRRVASAVFSLSLMLLAVPSGGPAAVAAEPPTSSRIVEGPDRRPYFAQAGGDLVLQVTDADPVRISLPRPMGVDTAVRHGDSVWIAGRAEFPEVRRMFVAEVTADGTLTPLPAPGGREQMRTFPTLLAERAGVTGIVWQEGWRQEDNSIRAAAWMGEEWGPVEVVSPPRGREQTGLTATVLADGSWLAVWAAVDEDDDLWWSRRSGGSWSEPRRVHADNGVPDILPRVAPTEDGALLAWTAYDGNDYRLHLAVFEGDTWGERPAAAGRGIEPARWLALADGQALLYSSVVPDVWILVGVDDSGEVLGRRFAARTRSEEPMVVTRGGKLLLRWPRAASEAASEEIRMAPARENIE